MHDALTRFDQDVGYTFIPGLKQRVQHEAGGYLVATNSLGFRSEEVEDDPRPRVFVFGDSFTAGDGVSNGKRWTDLLGERIPSHKFCNFGLPGTGTDQHLIAWQKFGAPREHDLLVVAVLVENIRRIAAAYRPVEHADGSVWFRPKPYFTLEDGALVRHHDPVPSELVPASALQGSVDQGGRFAVLRKLVSKLGLKEVVQQLTSYQPVPDYDDPDSPGWRLMAAILRAWSQASAAPMVIVPLPMAQHVEETADSSTYRRRFAELGDELGRPVIDPLDALHAYSTDERRAFRFKRDVHLTPAGHKAVANALAPKLLELLGTAG